MLFSNCDSDSKVSVGKVAALAGFIVIFGWVALTGVTQAQVEEAIKTVMLVPQDGGILKVDKPNQCRKHKHQGCLLFERGILGRILFYLPGSKNQIKYCTDTEFVITKIEVTAMAADGGADLAKGNFTGPFPAWLMENAFPDVDLETGIIYEATSLSVARSQEWVTNLNDHENPIEEADVIKSFWYRVTVTACGENADGSHAIWVSDPRGDNEGRH